jgi:hypothetical protein
MNKSLTLIVSVLLMNCSVSKKNSESANGLSDNCPTGGECTVVLHKSKSLNVKVDETGATYFQLLENEGTSVIEYKYQKKVDEILQDANYLEEVIFEIPNNSTSLNLSDIELQNTKMLFGRHCYCKGQAGYFTITNGKLLLTQKNNEVQFKLDFKIFEVPQIINSIDVIVK